jgi:hypothetical protein
MEKNLIIANVKEETNRLLVRNIVKENEDLNEYMERIAQTNEIKDQGTNYHCIIKKIWIQN